MAQISIVLPVFNGDKHLRRCIEAFLDQEVAKKRLLIVDAKSTDGSHDIIRDFSDRSEIIWLREEDSGISSALNIALPYLNDDDLFGFLGADDILQPGAFTALQQAMQAHPDWVGAFFDSISQSKTGELRRRQCPASAMTLEALLKYRTIAGMQNFYLRADLVKRYGFNEAARYSMDYELYLRLASDGYGEKIGHVPFVSTININDENISTIHGRASRSEALGFAAAHAQTKAQKMQVSLKRLRLALKQLALG